MKKIMLNNLKLMKYIAQFCPSEIPIVVFSSIIKSTLSILSVLFLKYTIDSIEIYNSLSRVVVIVVCFLVFNMLLSTINTWIMQKVHLTNSEIISGKMQLLLFDKAATLDLECYEDVAFYDKFAKAREQVANRMLGVLNSFSTLISSLLGIGALVALISSMESSIILLSLLNVGMSFLFNTVAVKIQHNYYEERIPIEREMNYVQRISSQSEYAKEIRMYEHFPALIKKRFNAGVDKIVPLIAKHAKKYVSAVSLQNITSQLINSCVVLFLAFRVVAKVISIGDFIALTNSTQQLTAQIMLLIQAMPELYEHGIYIESFFEFMNYEPKIKDKENCIPLPKDATVRFDGVSFKYPNTEVEAIKNISFSIEAGERIALVGRNGSGKSTIVKLLSRLYEPTGGTIKMNELPYQEYCVSAIRKHYGTLFQDYQIFAISVAENVLMQELSSQTEPAKIIYDGLSFADLDTKIASMNKGIYSELTREFSDDGIILSGGEYQRLALARVFVKESCAVILDEPSSALDPITEKEIFDKMLELTTNKTVIFVSHRLSNITGVDKIIYLENGQILEMGSHSTLMHNNGPYANMYRIQAEKYKSESLPCLSPAGTRFHADAELAQS